jgi:hypothetical protein
MFCAVTITGFTSVADTGCLSRILIFIHSGSQIPDLGPEAEKIQKLVLYAATNFTKLRIILN